MVTKVLGAGVAIALIAVAILAYPAIRHFREVPVTPPPPPIRLSLAAPPGADLGSGDEILDAAISPDERQIVFVATRNGTARLWRRALDTDRAEEIAGTDGARLPAWKQTGTVVSFFANDRLKQVSLGDGAVRDLAAASSALGASWLPDGSVLFAADARGPIRRLQNGVVTDATTLRPGDRSHAFPMVAGATDTFVYTATLDDGRRLVRLVERSDVRDLVTTSGHGQLVGDALLHVRDGALIAQRLNADTRQLEGRSVPLALDVGTVSPGHGSFTASGRILVSGQQVTRLRQLTWFSIGAQQGTPTRDPGNYWQVRLSPDDRLAAVTTTTPLLRTLDIVLMPMSETGNAAPLTRAVAADGDPVWSPDGRTLVFRSLQDGRPHLYTHAAHDEDAADQIVPMSEADETPTDWRGDRVVAHAPGDARDLDLWTIVPATGAREKVASTRFNETDARLSPDGRWIAYVSDESGQADIYAAPWPRGTRLRVSLAGGTRPRWARDGRSLFFVRGAQIMRAELTGSAFTTARAVLDVPGVRDFDVAHRRDALLALIPAPGSTAPAASVVVNWRSLVN